MLSPLRLCAGGCVDGMVLVVDFLVVFELFETLVASEHSS
jgi:hypothetical protein